MPSPAWSPAGAVTTTTSSSSSGGAAAAGAAVDEVCKRYTRRIRCGCMMYVRAAEGQLQASRHSCSWIHARALHTSPAQATQRRGFCAWCVACPGARAYRSYNSHLQRKLAVLGPKSVSQGRLQVLALFHVWSGVVLGRRSGLLLLWVVVLLG